MLNYSISSTHHHNFFGGLLLPHQHGSEVHTAGHCDVQAERVLLHPVLVLNLTTVFTFIFLFDFGEAEDDLSRSIGPALASWLGCQVFRALQPKLQHYKLVYHSRHNILHLEPCDGRNGVTDNVQKEISIITLCCRNFVCWLHIFGLLAFSSKRS